MPTLEKIPDTPEKFPASSMFQTQEQLKDGVNQALNEGVVKLDVVESDEDAQGIYIQVSPDKVMLEPEEDKLPNVLNHESLERRLSPEDLAEVHTMEAHAIQRLVGFEADVQAWWLREPGIQEDIESGFVTQIETIQIGDVQIPLVNFSDIPISNEMLDKFTSSIAKLSELSKGAAERVLKAICIQDRTRFQDDNVMGSAAQYSGVVRLSEKIFTGELDEQIKENKGIQNDLQIDYQQVTLIHEIGHLIQGSSDSEQFYNMDDIKFKHATGWIERDIYVTDDYGNSRDVKQNKRGFPDINALRKMKEKAKRTTSVETISIEDLFEASPVTGYGETNSKEDFAEALPVFVYAPEKLDTVRRIAIQHVLDNPSKSGPSGGASHHPAELNTALFEVKHQPASHKVKFNYNVASTPTDDEKKWRWSWANRDQIIVDDYGNEVTGHSRHGDAYKS